MSRRDALEYVGDMIEYPGDAIRITEGVSLEEFEANVGKHR